MKRLVALLLAVVFCVTLFSPTITAADWDISKGPRPDCRRANELTIESDDTPWADEQSSVGSNDFEMWPFGDYKLFFNNTIIFFFYPIVVPATEAGNDYIGNNETDDASTTLEDRGPSSR